jgi:hypothetical protein
MPPDKLKYLATRTAWLVTHPISPEDAVAAAALRSVGAPMKGKLAGTAGRGPFNEIMERVAVPEGVSYQRSIGLVG